MPQIISKINLVFRVDSNGTIKERQYQGQNHNYLFIFAVLGIEFRSLHLRLHIFFR
jgi:hypothetical protein